MRKKKRGIFGMFVLIAFIVILLAVVCAAFLVNHYYPLRHLDIISKYAEDNGLNADFVCAVIHAESRFNENAVSNMGASGLMQIIEGTAYWLAPRAGIDDFDYGQIFDPEINIRIGCYYLGMLERHFGDTEVALSAYNAGSGNVEEWLNNPEYSSDGKTLDYIPFPETRNYIQRVADSQRIYALILRVRG